ncbi:MAG: choice-of-anchor B family protein [Gammaproteobacteria bacterium]|nr:choice-of-anchor B family protein [Gammaproteobacteria bacterium]
MRILLILIGFLLASLGSFQAAAHGTPTACTAGMAGSYPCQNIDFNAQLTLAEMGEVDPNAVANDIWGWTDSSTNRDYAIVGLYYGTAFVDVTDPDNPVFIARLEDSVHSTKACHDGCGRGGDGESVDNPVEEDNVGDSLWMDIKVYGDVAYIGSEQGYFGIRVFDLTRLRTIAPGSTVSADRILDEVRNSHNLGIDWDNGYLYAVGDSSSDAGVRRSGARIYDLNADPLNPTYIGEMRIDGMPTTSYFHDLWCGTYDGPDADHQGKAICVTANSGREFDPDTNTTMYYRADLDTYDGYTYFDNKGDGDPSNDVLGFENPAYEQSRTDGFYPIPRYSYIAVLDMTDKLNPVLLDRLTYAKARYIHQMWPTDDHNYLLVNDELEEQFYGSRSEVYVYDMSDLDNLAMTNTYEHTILDIDHNMYVNGRYSYQSSYAGGVRILDIINPETPYEIGFFDTKPTYSDSQFTGSWSNFLFESGTLVISDMEDGLFVLTPSMTDSGESVDLAVDGDIYRDNSSGDETAAYYVYNNGADAATEFYLESATGRAFDTPGGVFTVYADSFAGTSAVEGSTAVTCSVEGDQVGRLGEPLFDFDNRKVICTATEVPSCSGFAVTVPVNGALSVEDLVVNVSARQVEAQGTTGDNYARFGDGAAIAFDTLPAMADKIAALRGAACDEVPVVSAGTDITAEEESTQSLAGSADLADAVVGTVAWTQVDGPTITFADASALATDITLPSVSADDTATLRLTVASNYGNEASDEIVVNITAKAEAPRSGGGGGGGATLWLVGLLGLLAAGRRRLK